MELAGKVIAILEPRSGVSKSTGNTWMVQSYVIETHEAYPKKMCFEVFGEDRIRQFGIQLNEEVNVSFDIDAHEYQGRWFNSIRAFRVDRGGQAGDIPAAATAMPSAAQTFAGAPAPAATPAAPTAAAAPAPVNFESGNDETSDLPF